MNINNMETHFRDEWIEAWFAFMCKFSTTINATHYENPIMYLSENRNITQKFIDEHPDFEWDWTCISNNPNITWDFVLKHRDKKWSFVYLSKNPNITLEIILANPHFFDYRHIKHVAQNPNVTMKMLKTHPYFTKSFGDTEYEWDWYWVCENPNITMDDIMTNAEIWQYGHELSSNRNITYDFVISNGIQNWYYPDVFRNPSICRYGMSKNEVVQLCYAIGQGQYANDDNVIAKAQIIINSIYATMQQINTNKDCAWNWYFMSSNKHLTLQMIKNNMDKNWDFEELFKNDLHEDRENYVEHQVCCVLLAMIYEEQRENMCGSVTEFVFADEYLVKLICHY